MNRVRCAIYTRKSSDEGLEQAFNSLDAQREACAAYVLSQASEGWNALPDIYEVLSVLCEPLSTRCRSVFEMASLSHDRLPLSQCG
jgi:hypothetical protein